MFGNSIKFKASKQQLDALRQQYRLFNKSDNEVVQIVWDQILNDPNFHTKNFAEKRTDSDETGPRQ